MLLLALMAVGLIVARSVLKHFNPNGLSAYRNVIGCVYGGKGGGGRGDNYPQPAPFDMPSGAHVII